LARELLYASSKRYLAATPLRFKAAAFA